MSKASRNKWDKLRRERRVFHDNVEPSVVEAAGADSRLERIAQRQFRSQKTRRLHQAHQPVAWHPGMYEGLSKQQVSAQIGTSVGMPYERSTP